MASPADHTFYGWSTTPDVTKGRFYKAGDSYVLQTSLTLYALWSGDGASYANPLFISTQAELKGINTNNDTRSKHYKLIADIPLTYIGDATWTPIGDNSNPFTGSLDGNGHSISKLKIRASGGDVGLFGYINVSADNIAVQNLQLVEVDIQGNTDNPNSVYAGAVAGRLYGGTIQGCAVFGEIFSNRSVSQSYAGGIVGEMNTAGIIQNCYISGTISALGNSYTYAGGIAGRSFGSIQNCYATGAVSADESNSSAGGIAGRSANGSIRNCVALNNNVSATPNPWRVAGNTSISLANNYGWSNMLRDGASYDWTDSELNGVSCEAKPTENWWTNPANWDTTTGSAWDFATIWIMGTDGYPTLRKLN